MASPTPDRHVFDGRYRVLAQARLGRDGRRLPAEDQRARPPRRDQDPRRALRERRPVRRALPPRGEARRGPLHPNIVSIYDRGEAEGTYYIAMEYLDGRTLKELIRARAAPDARRDRVHAPDPRARSASRTGTGSSTATSSRTTCSSTATGRLKVTDFGIARAGASADDRGRLDHRHRAVPLAGAGARRAGRPALRHLLARRRALRDAHRAGAVHAATRRSRSR